MADKATLDRGKPVTQQALAWRGLIWMVVGGILNILGCFAPHWAVMIAITLAQACWALGFGQWKRHRQAVRISARCLAWLNMAGLWAISLALCYALESKAFINLQNEPSLASVLLLCTCLSLSLVTLWRLWPLWFAIERYPHQWRNGFKLLSRAKRYPWNGLGGVAAIALLGFLTVVLMCLRHTDDLWQWLITVLVCVISYLGHWQLQCVRPVLETMSSPLARVLDTAGLSQAKPFQANQTIHRDDNLYQAARLGRVDQALHWLELGADAHALPAEDSADQRTLLMLAAVLPDVRLLQALLARNVDVNVEHRGLTALLVTTRDSWHGRHAAVKLLLAHGASPHVTDQDGNTPLHHAARSIDATVARYLWAAGAHCDAFNHEGYTPLALAALLGNLDLVRFFLAHAKAPTEAVGGYPPLLAASRVADDDPATVALLLEMHANPSVQDRQGRTALHEAASAGNDAIVERLLSAGAEVDARDHAGRTPWLDAAAQAHEKVIACLLAHGAQTTVTDADGRNALHLACQAPSIQPQLVQSLIEIGVAKDLRDHQGFRAVDHAFAAGHWSIVTLLDPNHPLPAAAIPDPNDHAGNSSPPDALATIRRGLMTGLDDDLDVWAERCQPDQLGLLLHDPQLALKPRAVEWLLKHGANGHARNTKDQSPMMTLLAYGAKAESSLQVYLRHGMYPPEPGAMAKLLTACVQQYANAQSLEQVCCQLVALGTDGHSPSPTGEYPIMLCIRLGWPTLLNTLITSGANVHVTDRLGMTALHLATALGRESELKCLIRHGALPTARTTDGQTPLGVALANGRRDLADWLDWRTWPLPGRPLEPSDLPHAAMAGDVMAVRRLIDLGLPIDATDTKGCTALLRAAGGGHLSVMRVLLEKNANRMAVAHSGATPLSAAVSAGHCRAVELLIDYSTPVDQALPGGVTALMLACAFGSVEIASTLLEAGANVNAVDAQGLSALHCAAQFGFAATNASRILALLDTLLLSGATPQHQAHDASTPLLVLLGARIEPGTPCHEDVLLKSVERMIAEVDDINHVDNRGYGPLHYAALHGLARVTQFLLQNGVDPNKQPTTQSPREIAIARGFIDVASLLAPQTQPVASMARFLKERG